MYFLYTGSEKGGAATRVVKMSAEKTVIHNPHPGTNTKVGRKQIPSYSAAQGDADWDQLSFY